MKNIEKMIKLYSKTALPKNNEAIIGIENFNNIKEMLSREGFELFIKRVEKNNKDLYIYWKNTKKYGIDKYIKDYEEVLLNNLLHYIEEEEIEINENFDFEENIGFSHEFKVETLNDIWNFTDEEIIGFLKNRELESYSMDEIVEDIEDTILHNFDSEKINKEIIKKFNKRS